MSAKDILLRPLDSRTANAFVRRVHYSGKVTNNSQLHIGVYLRGALEGVMSFGPSMDKRKIQGLVSGTAWHEFLELNRLAFTDALPRNSESRALSVAMRLLRKYAPQVKWVISFADATQCGDGTIYRAAGFVLTGIKKNDQIWIAPDDGEVFTRIVATDTRRPEYQRLQAKAAGFKPLPGFQLRYVYFIDPAYRARLTVPELPYSEIEKRGAGMYKGHKRGTGETDSAPDTNQETGGASPTVPLLKVKHAKAQ